MLEIILSATFAKKVWNKFSFFTLFIFPLISSNVWATPGKVEVWFLSETPAKATHMKMNPQNPFGFLYFGDWVQSSFDSSCVPMGDEGCFHPQYGMIQNDQIKTKPNHENESEEWKGKTINSLETEVVNCDKNYYFDLYCGKALKNVVQKEGVEIWVDTSGSFKSIDVPKPNDICARQAFAEKLRQHCDARISFSAFDTSIKPISDLSVLCDSKGGNDTMRIIRWISNSEAKELIVITDFSEYNDKLEVYLNSIGAQVRGIGTKMMFVRDLDSHIGEIKNKCAPKP